MRASARSFWFSYGGKNREVLERLVARFHDEQSQTRIDATFQGDYYEALAKLRTALSARVAPAMSHVVAEVVPYLAEAGVLERLDGYEGAASLDLAPEPRPSANVGGGRPKAARRGAVQSLDADHVFEPAVIGTSGGSSPRTWGELRSAANALTERRGSDVAVWGFACPVSWWFWVAMVGAAGGSLVDADGKVTLGGEAGERALALWQSLVHRDRVMRPPLGRDYNAWQVAMQDFLAGRAAMIWSSTAFLRYIEENARFEVAWRRCPRDA